MALSGHFSDEPPMDTTAPDIVHAASLAAHSPTQRALLQTADIANRLMGGGELHREAEAVR